MGTGRELGEGAASHGWELGDGIEVFELLPPESLLDSEQQQSLLYSSDLELGETTKQIFEAVQRAKPSRVVLEECAGGAGLGGGGVCGPGRGEPNRAGGALAPGPPFGRTGAGIRTTLPSDR